MEAEYLQGQIMTTMTHTLLGGEGGLRRIRHVSGDRREVK